MSSFSEINAISFAFLHQVRARFIGIDTTYNDFLRVLKQYGKREIDVSTTVTIVQKLFENHSDLLHAFMNIYVPPDYSSHTELDVVVPESKTSSCVVDLLNRVGTRFNGGGVYHKFLDVMDSVYASRGEYNSVSVVVDKVLKLFGEKHRDLALEFTSFLPDLVQEKTSNNVRKRKNYDREYNTRVQKKRIRNNLDDQEILEKATPTRCSTRRLIAKKMKINNDMEVSVSHVEVQFNQLISAQGIATDILCRLQDGSITSPIS